ncbi:plasmid replication initiator protein [Streptomyces sp. SID3343]|nr:replication initiator [Streptomyces sp. SID3343]MYW03903.1 plasmid replication initiator protein [Streptomyces sp. SID3343]
MARLHALTPTEQELIRIANLPGFARWVEQIRATGGCEHPIYLSGSTVTRDASGTVVSAYSTADEPGERLAVRCRNRRASRCAPCSYEHQGDTFHLVRAGLTGGKGTPAVVREHPRLFVTLTAPSFGAVHRATGGEPCRPRREHDLCEHGRHRGCPIAHTHDDRVVGQPLCRACYGYIHHTLWNAHTGELWDAFTRTLRRRLATAAGIPRSRLRDHVTLSFAKVAEYQARGAIHLHAVVRLDGPHGPQSTPPAWASDELLGALVPEAASAVRVYAPESEAIGSYILRWGTQLDVRPLRSFNDGRELTDDAVAGYLAKYVTKSTETAGATDTRITHRSTIDLLPVTDHVAAILRTCWDLGGLSELAHLRLRPWAHMLGFRGHCLSKSRVYSTTYGALRAARADYQRADGGPRPDDTDLTTLSTWRFAGQGHTLGAALLAAGIAEELATNREIAAERMWLDV